MEARLDAEPACRLVRKLREFARTQLDEEERALLAVLLAPGLAQAYDEEDLAGLPATRWSPNALPEALTAALRTSVVRVVGLDSDVAPHAPQP